MKITIDVPDLYDNPCARCSNNPMNNPHASGSCCCSLPDMYMKRTVIDSDRWMYETTTTTSGSYRDLCTSDSSMFNTTTTTYSSGGPIVSVEAPKFTGDVAYIN